MVFPNFDNEILEHRELRRLAVAHCLNLTGELMIDLDLTSLVMPPTVPPGVAAAIEDALDILGADLIVLGDLIAAQAAADSPDIGAGE